jgi:hypothetical protein
MEKRASQRMVKIKIILKKNEFSNEIINGLKNYNGRFLSLLSRENCLEFFGLIDGTALFNCIKSLFKEGKIFNKNKRRKKRNKNRFSNIKRINRKFEKKT